MEDRAQHREVSGESARKGRGGGQALAAELLGRAAAAALGLLAATWRLSAEGLEQLDRQPGAGRRVLIAFWHGSYLGLYPLLRGRRAVVLVSDSFRGAVLAAMCASMGYACRRVPDQGDRLGVARAALGDAQLCGIAVDGPLGPRGEVKRGAVRLASEFGFEVHPVTWAARRSVVLGRRWDRLALPWPGTRVHLVVGERMTVGPYLDPGKVADHATRLRTALRAAGERAQTAVR